MIDRYAQRNNRAERLRIKTASLKEYRLILSVLCILYSVFSFAQSNLTYTLRMAATDEVELLDNFPAVYETEKVNIRLYDGGKYGEFDESQLGLLMTGGEAQKYE